jgi:AcrR family transcriptional regulator
MRPHGVSGERSVVTDRVDDPEDEIQEPPTTLPRGRHGLPPDEVERRQRERIANAVVSVLAEIGYGSTTVERLHKEAGISRSTFYEYFANKREAVGASYDLYFERFCARLAARCAADQDSAARVRTAISAAVELAAEEPQKAQLLSGYPLSADPSLANHVFETHDRLALMLCEVRGASGQPDLVLVTLLETVTQVLARRLTGSAAENIPDLETRLVQLVLGARALQTGEPGLEGAR